MNAITPAMWQRMPWHPRAQAVAALDREYRALTRSLGVLRQLAAGTDATGWDPTEPWTEETGSEGLGKSVLQRQLAVCAAAGVHPFNHRKVAPVRVLLVDCENGSSLWLRWPEFGYGLRATADFDPSRRVVDFMPWRGDREERDWPKRIKAGGLWPWIEDRDSMVGAA